ncbi:MAG: hypothetical protein N3I35_03265 [Clostridia bacterium]|nr:hypothetical protein [Clostridia bacterium]
MSDEFYTNIGYAFVLCIKYIIIPLGVAVLARIIADTLLQPQPKVQRKKRSIKKPFQ